MTDLHIELGWLPRPPDDFSHVIKAVRHGDAGLADLGRLARTALTLNQLIRLAPLVETAAEADLESAGLSLFRLGILSSSTTDLLIPAIVGTGARHGLAIHCVPTDYGQVMQAALDPASALNRSPCDAVLVAIDAAGLVLNAPPGDEAAAEAALAGALVSLETIAGALRRHGHKTVVFQTVARPAETLLGSFDTILSGSTRRQIDTYNMRLAESVRSGSDRLLDVAGVAETVGLARWSDPRLWNLTKQPFAASMVPLYADHVCRLLAAMRGKSKKALILDLDNTLWGGVIGDDGIAGIRIGQGNAVGEAYVSFQRYVLAMRERGVLLAVASKNTDEIARQVFREHSDMLLREEHITLFQANWDDKASNIMAIADSLALGLDSFVFVDDNPAERGLIRRLLPQVAVPELPDDPALYARTVAAAGYFETVAFSVEDRSRAALYAQNAQRIALQSRMGGVSDYLRSLEMRLSFSPFDEQGRARITQLINKSNQFNLTTRRYSEEEITRLTGDPSVFTLQVRLEDIFGDSGMISTLICRGRGAEWHIDTWLMSCRVLGRGVERAVLSELRRHAARAGIETLVGVYRPTPRNEIVRDHYQKLGFALAEQAEDGTSVWRLDLAGGELHDEAGGLFAIVRDGFDAGSDKKAQNE